GHTEHALGRRPAEVAPPDHALVALAARPAGVDGHRGPVVEVAGELVAQRHRRRAVRQHVEVAAADARGAHPHPNALAAGVGFRGVDDVDALLGVADCSHAAALCQTMTDWVIRYDLRAPSWGTPVTELYAAALEQCAWADHLGAQQVILSEH